MSCAFIALPAAAQAQSRVDLATASPFVVLGGAAVTNTGPSVLYGDLGVSPGTSLPGFGLPAVVNGATHNNDAVAAQAQLDLTTAYNVAAGQPARPPTTSRARTSAASTLNAGAYRYTSDAQLTGTLTLDAEGDPNAQFVFQIASALTTASASSVVLINGASPCNVYWQIGSSATLGTTTAFQGNLMALTSITLNNGATVFGRMLARNGPVSLNNNVLDGSRCGTGSRRGPSGIEPARRRRRNGGGPGPARTRRGTAVPAAAPGHRTSRPRARPPGLRPCTDGFRATVRGARSSASSSAWTAGASPAAPVPRSGCSSGPRRPPQGHRTRDVQGHDSRQDADARVTAPAPRGAPPAPRPVAVHRMSHTASRPATPRHPPGGRASALGLVAAGIGVALAAPAPAAGHPGTRATSRSWRSCSDHVARTRPSAARPPDRSRSPRCGP